MSGARKPIREQPSHFWAWLAGFIDGDGCIGLYGAYNNPTVVIAQKDRKILERIRDDIGVGAIGKRGGTMGGDGMHAITWGAAAAQSICEKILPYLRVPEKVDRALFVLARAPISVEDRKNSPRRHPAYAEAIRLYSDGMGSPGVAKACGVSAETILLWAAREGIKRDKKAEWRVRRARRDQHPYKAP